jgi:hypothetical protein
VEKMVIRESGQEDYSLSLTDLDINEKLDQILANQEESKELMAEIVEKLLNLDLPGSDYSIRGMD